MFPSLPESPSVTTCFTNCAVRLIDFIVMFLSSFNVEQYWNFFGEISKPTKISFGK